MNVSKETRAILLGHKNGDITTHYSAPEIQELIDAVDKLMTAKSNRITIIRVNKKGYNGVRSITPKSPQLNFQAREGNL